MDYRTSVDDVHYAFKRFGQIKEMRMVTNERNESRGFCFITYARPNEAAIAVENMEGFRIDGRQLRVVVATNRGDDINEILGKPNNKQQSKLPNYYNNRMNVY